jgi:hypothetical protein
MNPQASKGYYSLIQYCPDLGRLEVANIGVLLFCPDRQFLHALTTKGNTRIVHFFGSKGHDWKRINSFKKGLEQRLERERSSMKTLADLQKFVDQRANLLQITPPRFMKVIDPQADLNNLYHELIGETTTKMKAKTLSKFLAEHLAGPSLARKLRTDIEVEVPAFGRFVEFPFGYQNGRFNLIKPVGFEASEPERSLATACKYAVEGQSLYKHRHPKLGDLQLVVVGQFRANDQESPTLVRNIFEENGVKLYSTSNVDSLVGDILHHGKDIEDEAD